MVGTGKMTGKKNHGKKSSEMKYGKRTMDGKKGGKRLSGKGSIARLSAAPTAAPTVKSTVKPLPTDLPTSAPSKNPALSPSNKPTTLIPTVSPTPFPSRKPTVAPSNWPTTLKPIIVTPPTSMPFDSTVSSSVKPTIAPSNRPMTRAPMTSPPKAKPSATIVATQTPTIFADVLPNNAVEIQNGTTVTGIDVNRYESQFFYMKVSEPSFVYCSTTRGEDGDSDLWILSSSTERKCHATTLSSNEECWGVVEQGYILVEVFGREATTNVSVQCWFRPMETTVIENDGSTLHVTQLDQASIVSCSAANDTIMALFVDFVSANNLLGTGLGHIQAFVQKGSYIIAETMGSVDEVACKQDSPYELVLEDGVTAGPFSVETEDYRVFQVDAGTMDVESVTCQAMGEGGDLDLYLSWDFEDGYDCISSTNEGNETCTIYNNGKNVSSAHAIVYGYLAVDNFTIRCDVTTLEKDVESNSTVQFAPNVTTELNNGMFYIAPPIPHGTTNFYSLPLLNNETTSVACQTITLAGVLSLYIFTNYPRGTVCRSEVGSGGVSALVSSCAGVVEENGGAEYSVLAVVYGHTDASNYTIACSWRTME